MRRRTSYYETLDDGTEVELEFEAIESTILQAQIGDKYVVAYCVQDDGGGCNPMKDDDGNGTLITDGRDHVITDGDPARHLGLSSLGGYRSEPEYDLESDEVAQRAREILEKRLMIPDEELRVKAVELRLEHGEDWFDELIEEKNNGGQLYLQAWEELYAEGKIGTYLAVPVNYCDSNHGPGTTSIGTTSLDNANAVWVPGQCEIDNMTFLKPGIEIEHQGIVGGVGRFVVLDKDAVIDHFDSYGAALKFVRETYPHECTYLEKLAVAEKYAESCLSEYEKWCNGEVYGCVVQVHDAEGKMLGPEEACWGFIGWEWAEQALKEEFFDPVCERLRTKEAA